MYLFLETLDKIFLLESRQDLEPIFYSQLFKKILNPEKEFLFQKSKTQPLSHEEQLIIKAKPQNLKSTLPDLHDTIERGINYVFQSDPTKDKGIFAKSIFKWFTQDMEFDHKGNVTKKGAISLPEDIQTTQTILQNYMQYGKKLQLPKPINTNHPSELSGPIKNYLKTLQTNNDDIYHDLPLIFTYGRSKIYKIDGDYHEDNCKRWMSNTDWCVQYPNMFKEYGPPFYMIVDNNQEKFLFHIPSLQFKDANNQYHKEKWEDHKTVVDYMIYDLEDQGKIEKIKLETDPLIDDGGYLDLDWVDVPKIFKNYEPFIDEWIHKNKNKSKFEKFLHMNFEDVPEELKNKINQQKIDKSKYERTVRWVLQHDLPWKRVPEELKYDHDFQRKWSIKNIDEYNKITYMDWNDIPYEEWIENPEFREMWMNRNPKRFQNMLNMKHEDLPREWKDDENLLHYKKNMKI